MPPPLSADTQTDGLRSDPRSDVLLARRAAMGDKEAFAIIFNRHGASLHRYALRMLNGDHQAAEDAVQEALTKAWLNIASFRGDSALRTWLFRMTANECHNLRRRRRPIAVDDGLFHARNDETFPEPYDQASSNAFREVLDRALIELPWRQRAAWLLREIEGLSYAEIAQVLHTTPTVIRGQLHRARATLKVRMAQWR